MEINVIENPKEINVIDNPIEINVINNPIEIKKIHFKLKLKNTGVNKYSLCVANVNNIPCSELILKYAWDRYANKKIRNIIREI